MGAADRFYATRMDLDTVLQEVHDRAPLKYIRIRNYDTENVPVYSSTAEIENFGIAQEGNAALEAAFLVLHREAPLVPVVLGSGASRFYRIGPSQHLDSIELSAGGEFGAGILI